MLVTVQMIECWSDTFFCNSQSLINRIATEIDKESESAVVEYTTECAAGNDGRFESSGGSAEWRTDGCPGALL